MFPKWSGVESFGLNYTNGYSKNRDRISPQPGYIYSVLFKGAREELKMPRVLNSSNILNALESAGVKIKVQHKAWSPRSTELDELYGTYTSRVNRYEEKRISARTRYVATDDQSPASKCDANFDVRDVKYSTRESWVINVGNIAPGKLPQAYLEVDLFAETLVKEIWTLANCKSNNEYISW